MVERGQLGGAPAAAAIAAVRPELESLRPASQAERPVHSRPVQVLFCTWLT
ncbi:MAG: hypothetical protein WD069_10925 [Planctomycetales bacterium]